MTPLLQWYLTMQLLSENEKNYIITGINENNKKFLKKLQILSNNDNLLEPSLLNAINRVR